MCEGEAVFETACGDEMVNAPFDEWKVNEGNVSLLVSLDAHFTYRAILYLANDAGGEYSNFTLRPSERGGSSELDGTRLVTLMGLALAINLQRLTQRLS